MWRVSISTVSEMEIALRHLFLLPALALAACAQPAAQAARDPHDVQASPPGAAQCHTTTAAENAAGASAANRLRNAHGLPPVRPNPVLAQAAAKHACDMARRGTMSHRGSTTTGPAQRVKALGYQPTVTAENIAAGPFSLGRVLAEWNASPGHQANIVMKQMREIGLGKAVGSDGKTVYWAAVYSEPRGR